MSSPATQSKGFFGSLFDFGFTSFITLKFLRVIYAVVVVLIILTGLFLVVRGLTQGGAGAVFGLVIAPILTLLYLVLARIYLEVVAVLFRIGENTTIMARALGAGQTPGDPGSSMPGPGYGPGAGYGDPTSPRYDGPSM